MYNVYVQRIFFIIIEIVHMNAGVSFEKENVKQSQSRRVTPSLDTPSGAGSGASHIPYIIVLNLDDGKLEAGKYLKGFLGERGRFGNEDTRCILEDRALKYRGKK